MKNVLFLIMVTSTVSFFAASAKANLTEEDCAELKVYYGSIDLEKAGINICPCPDPRFRDDLDYAQCLNYYGAISIQVPSDFNGVLPAGMDDKTYLERASFVHDYGSDLYKRQLAGQKAAIELERKQRERTLTDVELRNLGSDSMRGLKPVVRPRSGNKPKREDLK